MTTITIAGIIIVLLIGVVCFASVSQAMAEKRKQHRRRLSALTARTRNLKYLAEVFPANFLSQELTILLHKSLVAAFEQLNRLEPGNPVYLEGLQLYNSNIESLKQVITPQAPPPLTNPKQANELRLCLQNLHQLIVQLQSRGSINKQQAEAYSRQIQKLVFQVSVDYYTLNAQQAIQENKSRTALHYYNLAHKLLTDKNLDSSFQEQLDQLDAAIQAIESELAEEDSEELATDNSELDLEWEKFNEPDENWKKKKY